MRKLGLLDGERVSIEAFDRYLNIFNDCIIEEQAG
jgi:hypothetical protein